MKTDRDLVRNCVFSVARDGANIEIYSTYKDKSGGYIKLYDGPVGLIPIMITDYTVAEMTYLFKSRKFLVVVEPNEYLDSFFIGN